MVTRKKPAGGQAAQLHVLSEKFADPDLVDRIFEFIVEHVPELRGGIGEPIKARMRAEFGGHKVYIPKVGATERQARDAAVRRLFNGRNATEIARVLGVSRATVYRCLKQSGEPST